MKLYFWGEGGEILSLCCIKWMFNLIEQKLILKDVGGKIKLHSIIFITFYRSEP